MKLNIVIYIYIFYTYYGISHMLYYSLSTKINLIKSIIVYNFLVLTNN